MTETELKACPHCHNGFLGNRYGQDVECVNGVLIDIDVAHEGAWHRDVDYPVAPCHPMWDRQIRGEENFPNDCQDRLESWGVLGREDESIPPVPAQGGE